MPPFQIRMHLSCESAILEDSFPNGLCLEAGSMTWRRLSLHGSLMLVQELWGVETPF